MVSWFISGAYKGNHPFVLDVNDNTNRAVYWGEVCFITFVSEQTYFFYLADSKTCEKNPTDLQWRKQPYLDTKVASRLVGGNFWLQPFKNRLTCYRTHLEMYWKQNGLKISIKKNSDVTEAGLLYLTKPIIKNT